jgi:hypothetical protein
MGAMNGRPPQASLRTRGVSRVQEEPGSLLVAFDRAPTDDEMRKIAELPPSPQIAADLAEMVRRAMTFEIVARLSRTYVLSGVMLPGGPEVTRWLRRYIDGDEEIGPLGAPMPWPDDLPAVGGLLRDWGFERSPHGWVARGGTYRAPPEVKPS